MSTQLLETPIEPVSIQEDAGSKSTPSLLSQWWVGFAASAVLVVSGHLLIKAGLNAYSSQGATEPALLHLLHLLLQAKVAAGLSIYLLGSVFWMIAVSKREIGFLYPLTSINYVLVVIASILLFGESVSLKRSAGVSLIVLGMCVMNRRSKVRP